MASFLLSMMALLLGYWIYGSFVERTFGIEPERKTPALVMHDGVDFVPLGWAKIFLIQFLNIAGLGPIFGAILGALYGPSAFIWIVFGCIFAGAVHDFFSGMMSVRHEGKSIPEIVGIYLGEHARQLMRVLSIILLLLVGAVFMLGPATLLSNLLAGSTWELLSSKKFWLGVILAYYFIATILPIDQVIARIYPIFAAALLFMAAGIGFMLVYKGLPIPNIGAASSHPEGHAVWPMLCITIACGAISGFHATQSPIMARCLATESYGRRVFYGAMIAEGVVTMIWAAVAMSFFPNGIDGLWEVLEKGGPSLVVNEVAVGLLGTMGGMLAIVGVVVCPVTSGDTAFRSMRLIFSDIFKFPQHHIMSRLILALPLFIAGYLLTLVDFSVVWRYFAFFNQLLATVVLWAASVYMSRQGRGVWMVLLPAVFMTAVCSTYILMAPEGMSLPSMYAYPTGGLISVAALGVFIIKSIGSKKSGNKLD